MHRLLAVSDATVAAIVGAIGSVVVAAMAIVGAWYKRTADRASTAATEASNRASDSSSFVAEFREYVDTVTRENKGLRERADACERQRETLRRDLAETRQIADRVPLLETSVRELRDTVQAMMEGRA